ncbi:interleukin-1 receptor-associated kinase 4 [Triplophysa rosa]|uniref:Interleukin-1 receptor-associated kinase 4 n=1 Tax=Triplophysa rosa TaxID=992332 RepID=A0A9W7X0J1_TRIRA|nr:interleukin-1 receptor-associated kinase 4 [Triplophysa rosa]
MCDVTAETPVRTLRFSTLRKLSDLLDPQGTWRTVMMDINKPTGEARYTQLHLRRFDAVVVQGKSPTIEMLSDWGTTNCTVADLMEILIRHKLFAAVSVLLPDYKISSTDAALQYKAATSAPVAFLQGSACPEVTKPVEDITKTPREPDSSTGPEDISKSLITWRSSEGFYRFTHGELTVITGNWDERPVSEGGCRLGAGGFGVVFRGLMGNTPVAVKKLNPMDDSSPEDLRNQFNQEIQTLKSLKHVNLVEMVGYSSDGQHLCLVYAFMPNGSLLDRLACLDGSPSLSWQMRCSIATGTARGLEYLHCNNHIHRDVKSGNILLDHHFVPKISDFGLTRASGKRSCSTVMTERIVGTTAYMAPEALRGEITPKSDIFSFGVVLLEILSGLPPVDESRDPKLLMEMKDEIDDEEASLEDFIDQKMKGWRMQEAEKMYEVASQCLCEKKNKRPPVTESVRSDSSDVKTSLKFIKIEK